ncbi:MAG: thioredoxin-like domain-containing protein [Crocinitomicaceae bacterium]
MRLFFLATFLILSSSAFSQTIKFKITDLEDTTLNLVRYYGKQLYYADTAEIKGGMIEFDGSKQEPGILALFLPGQQLLEFVYNNEEIFIESKPKNPMPNARVKKSKENEVFMKYVSFISKERGQINVMRGEMDTLEKDSKRYELLKKQIEDKNQGVIDHQKELIQKNPDLLLSKIIHMSMDIDIPDAPLDEQGNQIDSNFRINYFKAHYWDNVNLKDDRLVKTPIFHTKLKNYFERTMVQHWDTVTHYAFDFCDQLNDGSDMLQYSVSWITSNYEKSNIMGMDKVFFSMGKKYYCTPDASGNVKAFWMPEDKLEKLCEKISTLQNLVMDVRPPNISLRDTTDANWKDFYSLSSEYTILYFWDPECGHCKKITPKLQTLYSKKFRDRNVEIFAVGKAVGEDFDKWKAFVKKHNLEFINVAMTDNLYKEAKKDPRQFVPKYTTYQALNYQTTFDVFMTPKLLLLDKDKKIIAKGLNISQLEEFLDVLQKVPDAEKLFPIEEQPEDEEIH